MIRLAHPRIPEAVHGMLREVLDSGMLTSGKFVQQLEGELSDRLGGPHVVLVSSGTTAALVAFHILREQGVSKVVLPDFLYPSIASSALRVGLEVLLVDVEPERLNIDLRQVAAADLGEGVALVTVDQFGIPGPNLEIRRLADERGWRWIEDAACALGSADRGNWCGSRADLAILSFHPRKVLTTGEGGALVTRDEKLAEQAVRLRNHGLGGLGADRRFEVPGYNARLSELHAAVGLAGLGIFDEMLAARRRLGRLYLELLEKVDWLSVPRGFATAGANFQSMVALIDDGEQRGMVMEKLAAAGVESTIAGYAIHREPAFAGLRRQGPLVRSDAVARRGIALPLHENLSEEDVEAVVAALKSAR